MRYENGVSPHENELTHYRGVSNFRKVLTTEHTETRYRGTLKTARKNLRTSCRHAPVHHVLTFGRWRLAAEMREALSSAYSVPRKGAFLR